SGKIDTTHILDAFKRGADGVLILGCPEGDCHFQDGNYEARKRVYLAQKVLEAYGIEPERLRIELSVDPKGNSIPRLVKEMSDAVAKLGPVKKVRERARTTATIHR
ncbi:MAG: hydrogenase iron-sulfur subunit, partial [Dehalococcoidia bacterium]|nr:hydrogenase iron-sulfur subunit [Dehalococcoidia bacterium]